jgi:hypothetical protein
VGFFMRSLRLSLMLPLLWAAPLMAADLVISVEIPQLEVAEYHRPYMAFWLERDGALAANLAVWYQLEKNGETAEKGEEWLKDMRQWWRRGGRTLDMPVDGISGATRAPGVHSVTFTPGKGALEELPAGEYQLLVEAAREVGGRELLKIPFQWPPQTEQNLSATGSNELGVLKLKIVP